MEHDGHHTSTQAKLVLDVVDRQSTIQSTHTSVEHAALHGCFVPILAITCTRAAH
jgi:hypothetical protein